MLGVWTKGAGAGRPGLQQDLWKLGSHPPSGRSGRLCPWLSAFKQKALQFLLGWKGYISRGFRQKAL